MMAVETFVYIYITAFALSALVAISLLVSAARRVAESDSETPMKME